MEIIQERVGSLTEYLKVVEKYNLGDQYLRGENQKYPEITSGLLRANILRKDTEYLSDLYYKLLMSYYREVGYGLDKVQDENFLAFSQHHGLKTNLIDFTMAPLVALYFACEKRTYNKNDCGYVYVLKEDRTVDATAFLREYSLKGHLYENVFNALIFNDVDIAVGFANVLRDYYGLLSGRNITDLTKQLCRLILRYPKLERSNLYIKEKREIPISEEDSDGWFKHLEKYSEELDIDLSKTRTLTIVEFIILFKLYFNDLRTPLYDLKPDMTFPQMPYFIYKTPLNFDRIKSQSGVFLYQGFVDYELELDGRKDVSVQKIVPDIVIQVDNQKRIMKELDVVGINKKQYMGILIALHSILTQR